MPAERVEPTEQPMNVLVILGHPRSDSFCGALSEKRTLAVRFGFRNALLVALFFVLLSATAAWAWDVWGLVGGAYNGIAWLVVPHAVFLAWLLYRHVRTDEAPGRIDGLMVAALSYVLWFGLVPLLNLALL